MEAYCQEVRRLEDKFHGLELNHIARRHNEATDELAKIASSRATVPPDVFAKRYPAAICRPWARRRGRRDVTRPPT
jgi:hypothetical protein